ncbi:MAG TPA: ester cyclase [Acidimicrobiia bacterium]|nr:ester cyclase [Acidimicrobiia bacterium]
MSTEENKTLVQRWFKEVVSQGDLSTFDAICAVCHPDFEMIKGVANPAPRGIEGTKELISGLRTAFPDLTATVDEQIAEGDKVVSVVTMTGTHKGDFMGMPATGRSFTIPGVSIWEVRGGQLISEWVNWDSMAMMQQLGVSAPTEA